MSKLIDKKLYKFMGSFSAVINFRTPLSSRWRHTKYHFFSGDNYLSNYSNIKIGFRFFKSRVFFKLGVYISHFVFSSMPYVSFLDVSFDRNFYKFQNKLIKSQFLENFAVVSSKPAVYYRGERFRRIYSNFASSSKSTQKFTKLRINKDRCKIFFLNFGKFFKIVNFPKLKYNSFLFINKFLRVERRLDFRPLFIPTKSRVVFKKHRKSSFTFTKGKRFNKKSVCYYPIPRFSNFFLTFSVLKSITPKAWENLGICFTYPNKKINWDNNITENSRRVKVHRLNSAQLESFSIKDQFYTSLMQSFRFFLTYYFRFDPIRFVKIFKYFNLKVFKEIKAGAVCVGYRLKWLKFAYKNISKWLLKKYYLAVRSPLFFHSTKKLQINNYNRWFGKVVQMTEPSFINLANFTSISAGLISSIFSTRLRMRERVNPVLYSLTRLVISRKKVRGLVIFRGGRFTKRQRALRSALRAGKVPFNSYIMPIDYGFSTAILKYSIVSIKVWISSVPATNFFSHGLEMSSNLSYPSSLSNFRIFERLYIKKIFKLANSMFSLTFVNPTVQFFTKNSSSFKFSGKFISSWNFGYFRAYRRFSKFYLSSKAKYLAKVRKNSAIGNEKE